MSEKRDYSKGKKTVNQKDRDLARRIHGEQVLIDYNLRSRDRTRESVSQEQTVVDTAQRNPRSSDNRPGAQTLGTSVNRPGAQCSEGSDNRTGAQTPEHLTAPSVAQWPVIGSEEGAAALEEISIQTSELDSSEESDVEGALALEEDFVPFPMEIKKGITT